MLFFRVLIIMMMTLKIRLRSTKALYSVTMIHKINFDQNPASGFILASMSKIQGLSRTSKDLTTVFKDLVNEKY